MLFTTPATLPSLVAEAGAPDLDPVVTAAVPPAGPEEALFVPQIADTVPVAELSPADRAFLFATGNPSLATTASPDADAGMTLAMAARPALVIADAPDTAATPAAAATEAFDPAAPIAYADPAGTEEIEAPFRALINPRPDVAVNWPNPETDHNWIGNPIPESARAPAQVRCMAEAIYFEARSEPVRGQLAVAQVVINRLKNPAYPGTVCGVVYQNQHMRNACQFSFACDGRREVVTDADSWRIAEGIAIAVLNGDAIWLEEVGASTHYHAVYVRPAWARQMQRMSQIGLHIFYRTYGGGWI